MVSSSQLIPNPPPSFLTTKCSFPLVYIKKIQESPHAHDAILVPLFAATPVLSTVSRIISTVSAVLSTVSSIISTVA